MTVVCKHCGSMDTARVPRSGLWDFIKYVGGRFPYRCRSCSFRFYSSTRKVRNGPPPVHKATFEVRAATERELTAMLLALSKAVEEAVGQQTAAKQETKMSR